MGLRFLNRTRGHSYFTAIQTSLTKNNRQIKKKKKLADSLLGGRRSYVTLEKRGYNSFRGLVYCSRDDMKKTSPGEIQIIIGSRNQLYQNTGTGEICVRNLRA